MSKIVSKNLKEAKLNLKIANEYYNRNLIIHNYLALQKTKDEIKYWKSKKKGE